MTIDAVIHDSLVDPDQDQSVVYYHPDGDGRTLYKVWMFISGSIVPYIDYVIFTLHPTFSEPVVKINRNASNPNCKFYFWTWGIFTVHLEIHLKTGQIVKFDHPLTYDRELSQISPQSFYKETIA